MQASQAHQVFPVFVAVWAVLGLVSAGFFYLNKNAALKRKVWPPFIVLSGVLLLGFVWALGFAAHVMYVAAPTVALITALNWRSARFCDACGPTQMNQYPFSKQAHCSKCGAKLTP